MNSPDAPQPPIEFSVPEGHDLFAAASGQISVSDFLLTRFEPQQLTSRIQIDETAQVDEHLAPVKPKAPIAPMPPLFPTLEAVAQSAPPPKPAAAPAVTEEAPPARDFVAEFQNAADELSRRSQATE
jgi:hypothetical protein